MQRLQSTVRKVSPGLRLVTEGFAMMRSATRMKTSSESGLQNGYLCSTNSMHGARYLSKKRCQFSRCSKPGRPTFEDLGVVVRNSRRNRCGSSVISETFICLPDDEDEAGRLRRVDGEFALGHLGDAIHAPSPSLAAPSANGSPRLAKLHPLVIPLPVQPQVETRLSRIFRDNLSRIFTRPQKTLGEKYFRAGPKPVETFRPSRPGLRPRHENRRRGGCCAAETTRARRGSTGERSFS